MHIPSSMLHGAMCPVTVALGAAGVGTALVIARKVDEAPSAAKFAAVTAMIFSLQMLNVPVQSGTSGHLLGGMLVVALLGVPWAVLSIALVLMVQAIFFADGGVSSLGANMINLGLIGAGAAGVLFNFLQSRKYHRLAALAVASLVSVLGAALACSVEVGLAGTISFSKVAAAMMPVHVLIACGEAGLTVVLVSVFAFVGRQWLVNERSVAVLSFLIAVGAAMLSPFASAFPDAMERILGVQAASMRSGAAMPASGLAGAGLAAAMAMVLWLTIQFSCETHRLRFRGMLKSR